MCSTNSRPRNSFKEYYVMNSLFVEEFIGPIFRENIFFTCKEIELSHFNAVFSLGGNFFCFGAGFFWAGLFTVWTVFHKYVDN